MSGEVYANNFTTTLAAGCGSGDATITVAQAAPVGLQTGQFRVLIDSEYMLVISGASTTTWSVLRGIEGTVAAAHLINATVEHLITAGSLTNLYGGDSKVKNVKGPTRGAHLIATGPAGNYGIANFATQETVRRQHIALAAAADIRLLYGPPMGVELPVPNPINVKAGIELYVGVSLLSSALTTGGPITSLPIKTLGGNSVTLAQTLMIPSGASITITDPTGAHTQTWTTTAAAYAGATTLTVTSQTPNFAYPAASEVQANLIFPVMFSGQQTGQLQPPTGYLLSDPLPIELAPSQTFYSRTYSNTPFGPTTTIASTMAANSTVIPVASPPGAAFNAPQQVTIDSSTLAEIVNVASVTGTGPYLFYLSAGTVHSHNSGVSIGQCIPTNCYAYSDRNEGVVTSGDFSYSGTMSVVSGGKTTELAANASAGDTTVQLTSTAAITTPPIGTMQVDTGGANPETVVVENVSLNGGDYVYYMASPLGFNHASGAVVTGQGYSNGMGPLMVVADHSSGLPPAVLAVGDSIPSGNHWIPRNNNWSFVDVALEGVRPHLSVALNSDGSWQFTQPANSMFRRRVFDLMPSGYVLIEYGINDLNSPQSFTAAQLSVFITNLIAMVHARGLKAILTTVIPYTSSTDNWATVANQTPGAAEAQRLLWNNNYVRANTVGADLICDTAATLETAQGGGALVWPGAGANGPICYDGTHPTLQGHLLMAAALTALLPQMT